MSPPAERPLLQALAALDLALTRLGAPAMIIGGMAVIARGVPRLTIDIDATVWGAAVSLDELFAALAEQEIVPRIPEAADFARRRQVLLLEHRPTGTPVEVSLGWLPFEREAMGRASAVDIGGLNVPVVQAEDLLVYTGASPEEIVQSFPTLSLPDVYATIAYVLRHRREVDTYLAEQEAEAETIRRKIEERYPTAELRQRLRTLKARA